MIFCKARFFKILGIREQFWKPEDYTTEDDETYKDIQFLTKLNAYCGYIFYGIGFSHVLATGVFPTFSEQRQV